MPITTSSAYFSLNNDIHPSLPILCLYINYRETVIRTTMNLSCAAWVGLNLVYMTTPLCLCVSGFDFKVQSSLRVVHLRLSGVSYFELSALEK